MEGPALVIIYSNNDIRVLRLVPSFHLIPAHLYVPDSLTVWKTTKVIFLWKENQGCLNKKENNAWIRKGGDTSAMDTLYWILPEGVRH
ncbi:hypothetical protein E2C01_048745 [Portunus trituberculatus]|uniref:Uncharacterized protein n=1 Tax=Portunus trituberculatus TaxID=210409 RepID=A0A5B7GBT5_PORTR|nr:hypothetical protein [Portunus trituberculatus]